MLAGCAGKRLYHFLRNMAGQSEVPGEGSEVLSRSVHS